MLYLAHRFVGFGIAAGPSAGSQSNKLPSGQIHPHQARPKRIALATVTRQSRVQGSHW